MEINQIEKYKHLQNIEIELRTKVDKRIFEDCLTFLKNKKLKNSFIEQNDFFDNNNNRKTDNTIIKKSNLFRNKIKLDKFECIFAINIENLSNEFKDIIITRNKKRYSFYEKYFIYDLTIVDSNNMISYEIEIELDTIKSLHHDSIKIYNSMLNKFVNLLACANI